MTSVTAWFDALASHDWHRLWSLHSPDAMLLVGPQLVPRHAIPQDLFAQAMQQVTASLPGAHPDFHVAGEMVVDGDVVRVAVRETGTGATVRAAFVCRDDGIVGMVVDPIDGQPLLAQCAADLAQVPAMAPWNQTYLTALHHSYARRRQGLMGEIRSLSDARFTCQGRGDCCQVGRWDVLVSDNEAHAGRLLTHALDLAPFQVTPEPGAPVFYDAQATALRRQIGATAEGACHQLNEARHCAIHDRFGWQPIPVCQIYPLMPARTPDGWDVTAYFSCRTVCRNEGVSLAAQESALRERFWPIQHRVMQIPSVLPVVCGATPTIPWEVYRWLEGDLLSLIDANADDLIRALRDGSRRLSEVVGTSASVRPATLTEIFRGILQDRPTAHAWEPGWMGGGYWPAWEAELTSRVRFQVVPEMLSRYLRTVLFRKRALDKGGIGLPWGITLLAYRMVRADACFRAWQAKRDVTSEDDLIEAIRVVDRKLGHQDLPYRLAAQAGAPLESVATWDALLAGVG